MNHFITLAAKRRPMTFALLTIITLAALLLLPRAGQAQDPVLPETTPEALPGLELFAQRCAGCHGERGQGDGALIAQMGATMNPMPFDAGYIFTTMPSTMFRQITDGEAAVGMPPFGDASSNPINEAGRWNLVAAVYSLATPAEDIAAGGVIYEAQCAVCHGDTGAGDGPDAAASDPPASDLTNPTYWFNRSNETVFARLAPGAIPAHAYDIADDDLRRAVDFARTFSYGYADPAELDAPIPEGVIFGILSNGTTDERLADTEVSLRAFTPDFAQTLTLTTTTDLEGNFRFDVTEVPPDWIYIAGAVYNDLSFSSGANQISRSNTTVEMPITVYDKTSDAAGVSIAQLHIVMEFVDDRVQVNQLYIVNNAANAVYVGPSGDPAQGVIEVAVPDGAQGLAFSRTFGSMSSFIPANDFVKTERGWADPLPLRPGSNALTLLVSYELPYTSGMSIAHPVFYRAATSTIIMPEVGVSVTNTPWVEQPKQDFGQGQIFRNYSGPGIPEGETITIKLEGRPSVIVDSTGATVANRDQTRELLIGGAALLLAAVGGVLLWFAWRKHSAGDDDDDEAWQDEVEASVAAPPAALTVEADTLLRDIAELDDAFEAGTVDEATYQARRDELKRQLAAVWQQ